MFPYSKIHIVGIGGAGLNGIANILLQMGLKVTGSDRITNSAIDHLAQMGVKIYDELDFEALSDCDLIIATSGASNDHPLFLEARNKQIPVWTRHQLFPELLKDRHVIAVAGTHGKTTTTSILAHILKYCGIDCGYLIGVPDPVKGGYLGTSKYFVIEADEYAKTFLTLRPKITIINNINWDHPDIYPTEKDYLDTFNEYAKMVISNNGILIANGDDSKVPGVLEDYEYTSFGFGTWNESIISNLSQSELGIRFDLKLDKIVLKDIFIPLHGEHNALNAAAALTAVFAILAKDQELYKTIAIQKIVESLTKFGTVPRRCEIKGENSNGVILIDDYAHAPKEIGATISGLQKAYPNRSIIAVWQPHSFNRVIEYEKDFIEACKVADKTIITPIYGARDSGEYSFDNFKQSLPADKVFYATDKNDTLQLIKNIAKENSIVVMLNAGDLNQMSKEILEVTE